jgi:hypothetical protein
MSEKQLTDIIEDCKVNGILFFLEKEQLKVTVKKGNRIPEDLMDCIVQQKAGIVRLLKEQVIPAGTSTKADCDDWFNEGGLNEPDQPDEMGHYEVMHTQAREYLRYEITGPFSYNITLKMKFTYFDKNAVEKVIETVITRHESLRTTFLNVNGILRQVIHTYPMNGFSIEYIHLDEKSGKEKIFGDIITGLSKLLFNLETGPLVNVKVVHYTSGINWLLFTMHHVISDAASLNILRNEFEVLYNAFTEYKADPLGPLPVQYKAYSRWVNNFINSDKGRYSREYYHHKILESLENEKVSGFQPRTVSSYKKQLLSELADRFRGKDVADIGERMCGYIVNIYPEPGNFYVNYFTGPYLAAFKSLAARNNATVFSVLVTTLAIAFYRIRKRKFLRICIPYSTRVFEPFDDVVGFLVGKVIVFIEVNERSVLSDLIYVVEKSILESANHRFYPNELLMKELDITLDVLSPIQVNYIRQKGVLKSFIPRQYPAKCRFDFRCTVNDYENGLELLIDYQLSKYTASEVGCMYYEILKILAKSS